MAKRASNLTRVYVDGYDLSGVLNAVDLGLTQETPGVTTFADAGPRRLIGTYDHTVKLEGLFDPATAPSGYDLTIYNYLQAATDRNVGVFFEGVAENSVAYEGVYQVTGQPRSATVGDAVMLSVELAGSNHLGRGLVLGSATISGTGSRTGRNMGATTSGQLVAATFRVLAGTFTSITMAVQESSNDGGGDAYANISGLSSTLTSNYTSQRLVVSTATEAWKRINVSAFSGTSIVMLVSVTYEAETA